MLYSDIINILIYTYTYIHVYAGYRLTQWITTSEDFFRKICTSHFIVRVRKGLLRVLLWEGVGDWTKIAIYWPPLFMAVSVVSFSFSRDAQPEAQGPSSLLDDGFLYCILALTSLDPNSIRGLKGPLRRAFFTTSYQQLLWTPTPQGLQAPSFWCGFPFYISSLTPSDLCLTSVLTELYNSSTPAQSPTQSLEWHVWSSSSGNNCHAVQMSLSSGASVYECIMGFFTLSHFVSQARLRDFLS